MLKTKVLAVVTALVILAGLLPLMAQADTATIPALTMKAVFTIGSNVVQVDGQPNQMDVAPYIDANGRTQVPVRYLAEVLGGTVAWNPQGQVVTLGFSGSVPTVTLSIGSDAIYYSGGGVTMDTAPVIIPPGRTMLPARYVAQAVGDTVNWDSANRTVTIVPPDPVDAGKVNGFSIPSGTHLKVNTAPDPDNGISFVVDGDKGSIASQLQDAQNILSQANYLDPGTVQKAMALISYDAKGQLPMYLGTFNSNKGGGILVGGYDMADGQPWVSVAISSGQVPPLPSTDKSIWPQSN